MQSDIGQNANPKLRGDHALQGDNNFEGDFANMLPSYFSKLLEGRNVDTQIQGDICESHMKLLLLLTIQW